MNSIVRRTMKEADVNEDNLIDMVEFTTVSANNVWSRLVYVHILQSYNNGTCTVYTICLKCCKTGSATSSLMILIVNENRIK